MFVAMDRHLPLALLAATIPGALAAQRAATPPPTVRDTLRIYYVGKAVGYEYYDIAPRARGGFGLTASVDYTDRGRHIRVHGVMATGSTYTPRSLAIGRGGEEIAPDLDITIRRGTADVHTQRDDTTLTLATATRAVMVGHAPASQHLMFMRYWLAHGRPKTLDVITGGAINPVTVTYVGRDTVLPDNPRGILDRYTIGGATWGNETVWLDATGGFAGFASRAGNLTYQAVRTELEPAYATMMAAATRDRMRELAAVNVAAIADGAANPVALVGATVVDATGAPPITNATVLVEHGRITAIGNAAMRLASNVQVVDAKGKTILPGLWDMHAHLTQVERAPGYMAVGVTSARDMGSEFDFIVQLRKTIDAGALGPHLVLAGLVDGGGANSFGQVDATTPEEGRAAVRRYHDLGFEQIKVYNVLAPAVVGAITREAHALGMTVTGHVPNALGLRATVDSGQDQIAHLAVSGDPQSDSVRALITWLRHKGTVFDPTLSWNELNGHSIREPVSSMVPGVDELPPVLRQRIAAMGATGDSATARERLDRQLAVVRAMHEAGIPIVAGTDMGVPGFSVFREIELYERAGFTRIDAIRAATAVPAEVLGMSKDVGTLEVGKRADLIVLDRNPLDNLRNLYTTTMVMKGGRLYRTADIKRAIGYRTQATP